MLRRIRQEFKQGKTLLQFGFLRGAGQALVMVAPLVVAKFFTEELFGSYSLAKMIVFFFSTLLIASSQTPFILFASQEREQSGRINKAFSVQLTFFVLAFCIFFAVTIPLDKYIMAFAKISRGELLFVLLAFVGLALKTFLCNLFMAMGQRIKNAFAELVYGILALSFVFVFYWTGSINLRMVFLIYLLSGVLVVLIFVRFIDFNQLWPLSFDKRLLIDMFNFTRWVMLGATAVYFINWGGNLVLRLFTSMDDIGTYNLGFSIFKGIVMLTSIVYPYFLPFVSQHIEDSAKMRDYLYNKRPKIFILGLLGIGAIFVISPYLFKLVYVEGYRGAVTVLRILLIGSVLFFYATFYDPILHSLKKYKFYQIIKVLQVLLSVLLALLLVPVIGHVGAAVATVIAYFFRAATIEIYFRLKLKKILELCLV
jgi:O-antigen/teichoic acid export membrane protein